MQTIAIRKDACFQGAACKSLKLFTEFIFLCVGLRILCLRERESGKTSQRGYLVFPGAQQEEGFAGKVTSSKKA